MMISLEPPNILIKMAGLINAKFHPFVFFFSILEIFTVPGEKFCCSKLIQMNICVRLFEGKRKFKSKSLV